MYDDDDLEGWADEDEMGLASAFVLGFIIVFVSTAVTGAAIAWNAISLASKAVQTLRRKP
jgi:hypothetical protein